jgi:hypothetical protein
MPVVEQSGQTDRGSRYHRTQLRTWLRLAGHHAPAICGPSGDVKWAEADPSYLLEAAKQVRRSTVACATSASLGTI